MAESTMAAEEVRAVFGAYARALMGGDADAWIRLWAEDGIQLQPGAPPSIGRDEVLAGFVDFVETMDVKRFDVVVDEVFDADPFVLARGHFTGHAVTRDEAAERVGLDGHFLTVFKRTADGSLVMFRDCYTLLSDA